MKSSDKKQRKQVSLRTNIKAGNFAQQKGLDPDLRRISFDNE